MCYRISSKSAPPTARLPQPSHRFWCAASPFKPGAASTAATRLPRPESGSPADAVGGCFIRPACHALHRSSQVPPPGCGGPTSNRSMDTEILDLRDLTVAVDQDVERADKHPLPASRCIDCELRRDAATVSGGPPRRHVGGRPAEVARSSRARIRVWISSHRSTWDGDAGLSVVDRRFGARCLPPYFSRFRRCWRQLVITISAGLDLRFLLNRREPTPHFQIQNARL